MPHDKLKSLLSDKWIEPLDGITQGMSFVTTDLSKIKSEHFHVDIDATFNTIIENKQYDQLGKYCEYLSEESKDYLDDIESIIWENFGTGDYRNKSRFLCKMRDMRYGFFIASQGSCGYNSCPVGGSYAYFYIGTLDQIYKLAMTDKDRIYHNNHK